MYMFTDDIETSFISQNLDVPKANTQSSMPAVSKADPTHFVSTEEQTTGRKQMFILVQKNMIILSVSVLLVTDS